MDDESKKFFEELSKSEEEEIKVEPHIELAKASSLSKKKAMEKKGKGPRL